MNWDNQNNQDPWGRKDQDEVSFDDLVKKFSAIFGKQGSSSMVPQVEMETVLIFPLKKHFYTDFLDFWLSTQVCQSISLILRKGQ